jgi:hypothetical protein
MKSINVKRLVVYLVGIFLLLGLPFAIAVPLSLSMPDPYVIAPSYLAPDKSSFNLDALKTHPKFGDVERVSVPGHRDDVFFTSEGNILRLVLPGPGVRPLAIAEQIDQGARAMKGKNGIGVAGEQSSSVGSSGQMLTKFSDGSVSFVEATTSAVFQVLTKDAGRAKTYVREIGLLIENPDISGSQGWFANNKPFVLIAVALVFGCLLLIWIFKGGAWVAAVAPRSGVPPVSASELKSRLCRVNDLDVPFQIVEKGPDLVTAEWRIDEKWRGVLEREQVELVTALTMKLSPGRRVVSVIETQRKLIKEQGILSWASRLTLFRGITFLSYDARTTYGLSYVNGEFRVTGYQYKFNIWEMKNPLIEVIISSGWKWEPHVLFV